MLKSAFGFALAHSSVFPAGVRGFASGLKRLYVGNLPWAASQEDLFTHFQKLGEVEVVSIPQDHSGRSRGFGFVDMDSEAAEKAIQTYNQSQFMGRTIIVNEARPREERAPREQHRREDY